MGTAKRARGIILVIISGILWGFSGTCSQMLSVNFGVPVNWMVCVRLSVSTLIFFIICMAIPSQRCTFATLLKDGRQMLSMIIFGIFGILACQLCYLETISYTNAGIGTVLEQLSLIIIVGVGCWQSRRKPSWREVVGVIMAIGGTLLIATQGDLRTLALPPEAVGWGLASAFAMASYVLLSVKLLERWGSLVTTMTAMFFGAATAFAVWRPWTIEVALTPEVVGCLAAMILLGTVAAYLMFLQGIKESGPVLAGLLDAIEPVAAIVICVVWLGTALSGYDLIGCALIISMMLLVTWEKPKKSGNKEA